MDVLFEAVDLEQAVRARGNDVDESSAATSPVRRDEETHSVAASGNSVARPRADNGCMPPNEQCVSLYETHCEVMRCQPAFVWA